MRMKGNIIFLNFAFNRGSLHHYLSMKNALFGFNRDDRHVLAIHIGMDDIPVKRIGMNAGGFV